MSFAIGAKPGVCDTGRAMMQSPTAASVKPSAMLVVSSRWGSRGLGFGEGAWAASPRLLSATREATIDARVIRPPLRSLRVPQSTDRIAPKSSLVHSFEPSPHGQPLHAHCRLRFDPLAVHADDQDA